MANVQKAVENIYPLVEPFQKPKTKQDIIEPIPKEYEKSRAQKRKQSISPVRPSSKPKVGSNVLNRGSKWVNPNNQFTNTKFTNNPSNQFANKPNVGAHPSSRPFHYVPKRKPVMDSDSDEPDISDSD